MLLCAFEILFEQTIFNLYPGYCWLLWVRILVEGNVKVALKFQLKSKCDTNVNQIAWLLNSECELAECKWKKEKQVLCLGFTVWWIIQVKEKLTGEYQKKLWNDESFGPGNGTYDIGLNEHFTQRHTSIVHV